MNHAEHFLSRLDRLATREVDFALNLYRDTPLVRAVIDAVPAMVSAKAKGLKIETRTTMDSLPVAALTFENVEVPVSALIAGPGRLRANATHLDFERPLAGVQLAVRRAGLDLDPGWLPWLGRVVAIRYVERWP